jgi:hypothetical protein
MCKNVIQVFNSGCRCLNCQCEAIFDIYVSRPFQWHQEHSNARCFAPCCRALNIRESRRTPTPQLFQVLGFTPTLGQVRFATTILPTNGRKGAWNCRTMEQLLNRRNTSLTVIWPRPPMSFSIANNLPAPNIRVTDLGISPWVNSNNSLK